MYVEYDSEADAIYIKFREGAGRLSTRRLDDRRMIDTDEDGDVGVELLFVSQGIDLDGLPRGDEIAAALNAIPHPV